MTAIRPTLRLILGALATVSLAADAQTSSRGRAVFEQKSCTQCHAYEARGLGASVREMKAKLKGDPARASAALAAALGHGDDLKSMSREDIKAVSEWLAGSTAEAPPPAAEVKQPPVDSAAARREAAAKARREAEEQARQAAEAKAQAKKDAAARARQEAEAKAQTKREAEAQAKRDAAAKREAADAARREADAKARKDTVALDAIKRENEQRNRREAEAQAAAKLEAEAKAKRDADALAAQKREAEERNKREADAKAKKDAEALAAQKREAEAKKSEPAAKADSAAGGKKQLSYRDGSDLPPCAPPTGAPMGAIDEERAKAVMERVGCGQCHAYIQKKTGPPMKKIYEKYKGDWECVMFRLKKNKTHGEEGVTDDLKGNEFKLISDYIATRGK